MGFAETERDWGFDAPRRYVSKLYPSSFRCSYMSSPSGSITYLEFPSRSHLLSASEDGTLCLFHARDWNVLRILKGHKGRVNCVAVHPSGKLALSVGQDRTLRMWDLMRGKGSASTKLGKGSELLYHLYPPANNVSRGRAGALVH